MNKQELIQFVKDNYPKLKTEKAIWKKCQEILTTIKEVNELEKTKGYKQLKKIAKDISFKMQFGNKN